MGVYYYPWYAADFHGGAYLRKHLIPRQWPELGEYNDQTQPVIDQHLAWSRSAYIDFWTVSWWGPGSREDITLRNTILLNRNLDNTKIAIHYETDGLTKGFTDYSRLAPDISYLATNYFNHSNYLKIDGKPVIFVYLTRVLSIRGQLSASLDAMRKAASSAGYSLYIIGDQVFGPPPISPDDIKLLDAVTNYDVYGSMGAKGYAGQGAIDNYYTQQLAWRSLAKQVGTAFIPAVTPGFNDRAVRDGHQALSRQLTQGNEFGTLFRAMVRKARDLTDPATGNMLMITSWNEWHEDTQIEPVRLSPPTSQDDSSTGQYYTEGLSYEGYGERYLSILREEIGP